METVFASSSSLQSPIYLLNRATHQASSSSGTSKVSFFSLPRLRNLHRNAPFPFKFRDCSLLIEPFRMQRSSLAAVVGGDTAAVAKDGDSEQLPFSNQSEDKAIHEGTTEEENEDGDQEIDTEDSDPEQMITVCDNLIKIFMVDFPTPKDWRRLLAFSRTWEDLRPHFYWRCQMRADTEEDPGLKHQMLRFQRKLKEVDADVQRHNELIEVIRGTSLSEIRAVVSRRRKDFTQEFFVHLLTLAQSYLDDPNERKALEKLANESFVAVQEYETASESMKAMQAAELKFQDLMNSPSVDDASRKIDNLAKNKELDPFLALLISKAWSESKETDLVKEEAKDLLFHLYKTAVANMQLNVPKEVRILKYLITLEDPQRRLSSLNDAFTPGEEVVQEGIDVIDQLYTTPEDLLALICSVLDAYYNNYSKKGSVIMDARDLVNVNLIPQLENLKNQILDNFM